MKKIWIRNILKGLSLTSAMFIFQACYGIPDDGYYDVNISGEVLSKTSGLPIGGIKVTLDTTGQYTFTDSLGRYSMWTEREFKTTVQFQDIDSIQNSYYQDFDTVLTKPEGDVLLNVMLEDK